MKSDEFVLDCSVTMTWCFAEEATKKTIALRDCLLETTCHVPSIWPLEINNVLWSNIKRKRISLSQSSRFKYLLKSLPINIDLKASDLWNEVILDLANEYNITCYDAAYLELALRENLCLATLDKDLAKAAKKAGIKLIL
jgi:predicted nucleic acid-binding protein